MRTLVVVVLLLTGSAWAQATLSPSAPVVNQGTQLQFSVSGMVGTSPVWSVSGTDSSGNATAGLGTITQSGLYTAPASVTAQQTEGGYQLLPNNHVFNTRIDSLPQNSNNTTWMNVINGASGSPSFDIVGMPINYIDNTTPTQSMVFYNGSSTNGTYGIALLANAKLEGGLYGALSNLSSIDHHFLHFNTATGALLDLYQYYAQAPVTGCTVNGSNVVVCNITPTANSLGFGPAATAGFSIQIGSFTGADTWANVKCPLASATATSLTFTLTGAAGCATHAAASTTTSGSVTLNVQTGNCAASGTCNSQGGSPYNYSDYTLPAGNVNAAGMPIQPLTMRLEEWNNAVANGGTINHALRFTSGGFTCSCFIWPALASSSNGSTLPFGARWRLKSSFSISGYSAADQILLKQLQQYGIILADNGNNWAALQAESNRWPANYITASADVGNAQIVGGNGGLGFSVTNSVANGTSATVTVGSNDLTYSANYILVSGLTNCPALNGTHNTTSVTSTTVVFNTSANCATHSDTGTVYSYLANYMEAIDESGLQSSCTPCTATSGLTNRNREIVTYTDSNGAVSKDVALQGVAVNFSKDYLDIMAGTPGQQLVALVNIGSATWSMSPAITGATLSSNGFFTVPATLATPTTTTITATSTVNGAVSASMSVTVYPNAGIRIIPGQSADYTDSFSNLWHGGYGAGTSQPVNGGCCAEDGSFSHGITDFKLWSGQVGASSVASADTRIDMLVPNGTYQVTYRYGTAQAAGVTTNNLAVQGNVFLTQDFAVAAGGQHLPYSSVSTNVTVTDNHLRYVIYGAVGGSQHYQAISSLSIIPGAVARPSGSLP